jgi:hypothetical protein
VITETDKALAALRKQWGERWEVWVVHRVYGGPLWCARRHDNHRKVINADTPEHLSEYLAEAEADHGD